MESQLKNLFGDAPDADAKTAKAQDFFDRATGAKQGAEITGDEAVGHLNSLLKDANSDQVEKATKAAIANLPSDQQKEFADYVNKLHTRTPSSSGASTNLNVDDISKMFGQAGGSATSVNDLLGSLSGMLGGASGGTGGSTAAATGGIIAMISSLLSGLFGGKKSTTTATTNASATASAAAGDLDVGNIVSGPIGKAVIGGIAAYLMKEMASSKK